MKVTLKNAHATAPRADLLASNPKAQPRPEINPQRGISNYLFILLVEGVLHVDIRGHSRMDRIPSPEVDARVSGRVIEPETKKIRVRPAPDKASAEARTPARPKIIQQQASRMLRPAQQRLSGKKQRTAEILRRAQRRFENLRRGVVVRRVKRQLIRNLPLEFDLGALCETAIQVEEEAVEVHRIRGELNLIPELVVEVHRRKRVPVVEETLLKSCLVRSVLFRLQIWIRVRGKQARDAERFLKGRLLDRLSVRKPQTCPRKCFASAQRKESNRTPRHDAAAEAVVVHVAQPGYQRPASTRDALLCEQGVIQPQPVCETVPEVAIRIGVHESLGEASVLVFELVAQRRLQPAPRRVVSLIVQSRAVDVRQIVEVTVEEIKDRRIAAAIGHRVGVLVTMVVFVSCERVLPVARPSDRKLCACEQVVLVRTLLDIRWKQLLPVEIPLALNPGVAVRMPRPHSQERIVRQPHAEVSALQ